MFSLFNNYEAKRKRLLKKAPAGPLRDFLSVPFPPPDTVLTETPILAVDFETTGLDANKDQILSIGHITVENFDIQLSSAHHQIIRTKGKLDAENVAIHQIMDDTMSAGESLENAVEELLSSLAGKVMLVHFGKIEKTFLEAACNQLYGLAPTFPMIDTLMLAKKRMERNSLPFPPSALRLFNLRETSGLPRYSAHNALSDALATAELFFAEVAEMNYKSPPPLKTVIL